MAPQDDKSIAFRDSGALFLCRPDLDEGELIREQGKEMHGLVLQAKHLVRKPNDPPRTDLGRAAREAFPMCTIQTPTCWQGTWVVKTRASAARARWRAPWLSISPWIHQFYWRTTRPSRSS